MAEQQPAHSRPLRRWKRGAGEQPAPKSGYRSAKGRKSPKEKPRPSWKGVGRGANNPTPEKRKTLWNLNMSLGMDRTYGQTNGNELINGKRKMN
jgi:hypothetical protein